MAHAQRRAHARLLLADQRSDQGLWWSRGIGGSGVTWRWRACRGQSAPDRPSERWGRDNAVRVNDRGLLDKVDGLGGDGRVRQMVVDRRRPVPAGMVRAAAQNHGGMQRGVLRSGWSLDAEQRARADLARKCHDNR